MSARPKVLPHQPSTTKDTWWILAGDIWGTKVLPSPSCDEMNSTKVAWLICHPLTDPRRRAILSRLEVHRTLIAVALSASQEGLPYSSSISFLYLASCLVVLLFAIAGQLYTIVSSFPSLFAASLQSLQRRLVIIVALILKSGSLIKVHKDSQRGSMRM